MQWIANKHTNKLNANNITKPNPRDQTTEGQQDLKIERKLWKLDNTETCRKLDQQGRKLDQQGRIQKTDKHENREAVNGTTTILKIEHLCMKTKMTPSFSE